MIRDAGLYCKNYCRQYAHNGATLPCVKWLGNNRQMWSLWTHGTESPGLSIGIIPLQVLGNKGRKGSWKALREGGFLEAGICVLEHKLLLIWLIGWLVFRFRVKRECYSGAPRVGKKVVAGWRTWRLPGADHEWRCWFHSVCWRNLGNGWWEWIVSDGVLASPGAAIWWWWCYSSCCYVGHCVI